MCVAGQLLPHGQILQCLPAALFAGCPGGRCGEMRQVLAAFRLSAQPKETTGQITHPTLIRLHTAGLESHGLPIGGTVPPDFFEKGLIVQTAVPTLPPVGTGEGDVLSCVCPGLLISLVFHELNEALPVTDILQGLVDDLDQIQLPTVRPQSRLVLSGLHPFLLWILFQLLQHPQSVGRAEVGVLADQLVATEDS